MVTDLEGGDEEVQAGAAHAGEAAEAQDDGALPFRRGAQGERQDDAGEDDDAADDRLREEIGDGGAQDDDDEGDDGDGAVHFAALCFKGPFGMRATWSMPLPDSPA